MSTFVNGFSHRSFNTSPTILQVIPALRSGGVEIEALEIGNAILSAGGRSLIASNVGEMTNDPRAQNIELINLPLDTKNPFRISKNIKALKELILKEKIDLVHVRSRAPAWSAYKATRALGIPFVTTYHAAYNSNSFLKTFYNSVMARGDRVIAISQFIFNHLIKTYSDYAWFDSSKLRLIQRGIDLNYFDPTSISEERVQHLRKSWELPPNKRILLIPGRISKTKGQDILIEALSLMKHTDITAVLVGSAQGHESYKDNLLSFAASLDLGGRVRWFSHFSDIAVAYQLADLIVCPSLVPEGFGRLMAEAQAMRKPIIASDHGAAQEVIQNGKTGWLTPPGNPGILAEALDKALDLSPSKIEKMGKSGRIYIEQHFSRDIMFSKTLSVYEELLGQKKSFS
ncbi:MAG: glycosyltransferase family 4 protein [Proteobacteria bacterium]|nr:glycosyltransferase family 4 protein [Pseudomonadota bacterium]